MTGRRLWAQLNVVSGPRPNLEADQIATERLNLDRLRPEDAEEMSKVLGDAQLHAFTEGRPLVMDELRDRYRRLVIGHSQDGTETWMNWIVRLRQDGRAVGTVQATLTSEDGDILAAIAWVVGIPWQRQGIATEAAIALVAWLESHGANAISANVHPDHIASKKVAARAGLIATRETTEEGEEIWRRLT